MTQRKTPTILMQTLMWKDRVFGQRRGMLTLLILGKHEGFYIFRQMAKI